MIIVNTKKIFRTTGIYISKIYIYQLHECFLCLGCNVFKSKKFTFFDLNNIPPLLNASVSERFANAWSFPSWCVRVEANKVFGRMLWSAFYGHAKKETLFFNDKRAREYSSNIRSIVKGEYANKSKDDIHSSGYVVDSLEAALWCFESTDSFKDAVLKAVNLGHDADTIGAICGQIADAYYGVRSIPSDWLEVLFMRDEISDIALQLLKNNCQETLT